MLKRVILLAAAIVGAATVLVIPGTASARLGSCDKRVAAPADLNAEFRRAPEGAVICLSGTFRINSPLVPRHGQVVRGPAAIVNGGGVEDGFFLGDARHVTISGLDISGFTSRGVRCGAYTRLLPFGFRIA